MYQYLNPPPIEADVSARCPQLVNLIISVGDHVQLHLKEAHVVQVRAKLLPGGGEKNATSYNK